MEIKDDLQISAADTQHHAFNILLDGKLKTFKKQMGTSEVFNMMKNVGITGSIEFGKKIRYKLKNNAS